MGLLVLLFWLALIALNYFAISQIIAKAGYSRTWLIVPLTPVVLLIITMIVAFIDLRSLADSGFTLIPNVRGISILWALDGISSFVAWVFFLIFAFSAWPVSASRSDYIGGVSNSLGPQGLAPSGAASTSGTPWKYPPVRINGPGLTGVVPSDETSSQESSALPPSRPTDGRRAIHCAWCGESIPGNRALGHDCGPKDRPEAFCRYCGRPFNEGSSTCTSCD